MAIPRIPSLTLPVTNFEEMLAMSNRRLIGVLRSAVLAPENMMRFSPQPPTNHDAYTVRHEPGRIAIHLYSEGTELFICYLVPPHDFD